MCAGPGEGTRPMMEKVRGAVFSMVASLAGSQPLLPPGTRWLDLFAGTGELSERVKGICLFAASQISLSEPEPHKRRSRLDVLVCTRQADLSQKLSKSLHTDA